jgi:hypothetical protein
MTLLQDDRARVAAARRDAGGDDAEALARLFEDPRRPGDGPAAARMRAILVATERRWIRGLQTGVPFGDAGFRGDREPGGRGLRDPWAPSRNQVGHFLTAVGLAFRPETVAAPVLGVPMRALLGAPAWLSDERVAMRLTVGHELAADLGVRAGALLGALAGAAAPLALGLRGRAAAVGVPAVAAVGGLAGALAQQFLGFRRQFHRATAADERAFERALAAAGPGPRLDLDAIERALRPLFDRIDVHARGNSHQDLRLSLLGWWLGDAIRRGTLTRSDEVAAWLRAHLKG